LLYFDDHFHKKTKHALFDIARTCDLGVNRDSCPPSARAQKMPEKKENAETDVIFRSLYFSINLCFPNDCRGESVMCLMASAELSEFV
jgi:hypothetical protein